MKTIYYLRFVDYEIEEKQCLNIRRDEIVFDKYTHSRISDIGMYFINRVEAEKTRELNILWQIKYYEKDIEYLQNKLNDLKNKLWKKK